MKTALLEPADLPQAISLLEQYGEDARILAGGISVVLMLQQRLISPAVLVNLARLSEQDFIRIESDGLHIGAMTRLRELECSQTVRDFCPALGHALRVVGNVRVRNQATLGGNLCAADYAADPPAMLTALDARLQIVGPAGEREIPLSEFILGFYSTALRPGEILVEIIVPPLPRSARASYQKFSSVSAEGRPCVAVGIMADFDAGGRCNDLRIAIGAALETPQRVPNAERLAHGQALTDELVAAIANEYSARLEPLADVRGSSWYRKQMIRVFVQRALEDVRNGHR